MSVNVAQMIDAIRKLLGLAHRGAVLIGAATSAFDKIVVEAQKGLDAIAVTKAANLAKATVAYDKYVATSNAAADEAAALAPHEDEAKRLIEGVNRLFNR